MGLHMNTPSDALIVNVSLALQELEKIKTHLEDHLGTSPDAANWNHVGSAGKAAEDLKEIAHFLNVY